MQIEFNNFSALHWLWFAAILAALAVHTAFWRGRALRAFLDSPLVARIAPTMSLWRPAVRSCLVLCAIVWLIVALMDPRWGVQSEEVKRRGADVMFVIDVSRSMLAEDATPNRLSRAKAFVEDAVSQMAGDRVGVVDFAGVAALRTPLTLNYAAALTAIDELQPKSSLRGGSMLGDALTKASESFSSDSIAGRAIVVLSDGEDMGSDPVAIAKSIFDSQGIRIFTVGLGDSADGARIPVGPSGGGVADSTSDRTWIVHDGQEVWTKMDAATLRDVAASGGGVFVPAGTAQVDLGEILQRSLADLQRGEFETSTIQKTIPRFQWPAGIALLLLVIETLIQDRKTAAVVRTPIVEGVAVRGVRV